MAKKSEKNDVVEDTPVEEKTEEALVRRGQAVPVDPATGGPMLDAPAAVQVVGSESTSHVLAKTPDAGCSSTRCESISRGLERVASEVRQQLPKPDREDDANGERCPRRPTAPTVDHGHYSADERY
jgi:hypothetical protein